MIVTALLLLTGVFGFFIPQEILAFHNNFSKTFTTSNSTTRIHVSTGNNEIKSSEENSSPEREITHRIRSRKRNTPKPTESIQPTSTPKNISQPSAPTNSSSKDFIMNAINDYRKSKGLSEVKTDPYACDFAKLRAQEISSSFNHDGFRNRINNKSLPYPGYHEVTENIAMTSDYKKVVNLWINSSGHAENMRRDTPYVCVENFGNYYAYEGWKP